MRYFGFAISDSMFASANNMTIVRIPASPALVRSWLATERVEPCLNPSHSATIAAMRERFGINIPIPETPPQVSLRAGDRMVVMSVRGLPRLTDRREYTAEEIERAEFDFAEYVVMGPSEEAMQAFLDGIESAMKALQEVIPATWSRVMLGRFIRQAWPESTAQPVQDEGGVAACAEAPST